MQFNYIARTKKGETQEGTIEASSQDAAINILQQHGLIIIKLEEIKKLSIFLRKIEFFERVKPKDIVIFSRQISTMFESKVPPVTALRTIINQTSNTTLRDALFEIAQDVEAGTSLSQAMSRYPKIFSPFYVNMIRSGEVSGKLQEVFSYLADYIEREYDLASKAKSALIYPIFVIATFIIISVLMLIFVIPQLTAILKESGQKLPLMTQILIGVSDFTRSFWWLLILILLFIIGLGYYYKKTERGQRKLDEIELRLPIFGEIFRKIYLARFSESLHTLIVGGLPIIQALTVVGDIVGNSVYKGIINETIDEVKKGGAISSVFKKYEEIPPMVSQMISIGEETGKLDTILKNISNFYTKEVNYAMGNLVNLIEPIIIIVLAVAVGILVASILMPIYNLARGM